MLKVLLLESSFLLNWSRRPPGRYQRYGVHLLKKDQQNSTVEIQEVVNMTIGWSFSLYCNCTVVIVTDNDGSVTQLVGYPMGHKLGHKYQYLIRVLGNSWNIQPSSWSCGHPRADSLIPNFQVPNRASLKLLWSMFWCYVLVAYYYFYYYYSEFLYCTTSTPFRGFLTML